MRYSMDSITLIIIYLHRSGNSITALLELDHFRLTRQDRSYLISKMAENPRNISVEHASPNTWKQCKLWIADHTLCDEGVHTLVRTPIIQQKYEEQQTHVSKYYVNYSDYIKHKIFKNKVRKMHIETMNKDNKCLTTQLTAVNSNQPQAILISNDFGYHLEKGVHHLVLFSTQPINEDQINTMIEEQHPNKRYLWWRNPVSKQSIPDIWHVQVLVNIGPDPTAKGQ
eukprot:533194_1